VLLSVEAEMSGILSDILSVTVMFVNIKITPPSISPSRDTEESGASTIPPLPSTQTGQ
jgi:hypothetical protein